MPTKPLPGIMDDPSHQLSKGCMCHLLMNEGAGSLTYDVSGHGNHGALKNMLPNVQGSGWCGSKFGGGLDFDGSNGYINCGTDPTLKIEKAIAIEAWVKGASFDAVNVILSKRLNGSYGLSIESSGGEIYFYTPGTSPTTLSESYSFSVNQWYHIIATFFEATSGTNKRLYVNGREIDNTAVTGNIDTNDVDVNIGKDPIYGYHFNGTIAIIRLFDRTLDANEITQLYHDPFSNLFRAPTWQRYVTAKIRSYGYIFG